MQHQQLYRFQMYAYIFKKTEELEAEIPLQIDKNDIGFFIEPIKTNANFKSTTAKEKWGLVFFKNSPFEQAFVIHFQKDKADASSSMGALGRACWRHANPATKDTLQKEASVFLRGSETLPASSLVETTDGRILAADRDGIAYFSNSFASFERVVLCHALAIAYSQVLNESIFRLTTLIRSNEDEETLLLYEEILKFNAADYFSFPVRIDRHELFSVWQTLAKHYRLKELSCEVTQQLSDIAQLLRAKNDRLLASQEKERERIANLAKDLENKRDKTRAFRLTVLGLVIAASSLPSCTPEQFAKARDSWLVFFKDNTPEKKTGN